MQTEAHVKPLPRRVLVVEDTVDIRELLTEILTDEGYEVISAANGAEALEALRDKRFELVLLDLMMPIMNGFELLTRLQTKGDTRPPVVAMSAFERFRREAVDLGAQSFLSKPVDIDRLLQEVDRVITIQQKAGGLAREALLEPQPKQEADSIGRALRQLEFWLQVERATFRPADSLRNMPLRSMLVLGDASSEDDLPGGLYVRLLVHRGGDDVAGFLELADGHIRDLLGEELALAQFVADWIGSEGASHNDIGSGDWGPRLSELVAAVVFEQARREGRPVVLAVVRGDGLSASSASSLGESCRSLAFGGLRSPGELLVVGNGRRTTELAMKACLETLLHPSNPTLRGAAIGLLLAEAGHIPLFSDALAAVLGESHRIQQTKGHGVGRVALPAARSPSRPPHNVTRH